MFTGLVEEVGTVESVTKGVASARITIRASNILKDTKLGDSISTNGVCLTVTDFSKQSFSVDVMAETMRRSNLYLLRPKDAVNLERALRVGDRLGGHFVSGHIDGMGIIKNYQEEDNAVWITISAEPEILRYVIQKGSIAIDGISLTIAYIDDSVFKVSIIPHTKEITTLLRKNVGEHVNLECDMIGKYIGKLIDPRDNKVEKKAIDLDFLNQHGFL
ncbi:riboflavin synthase [Cellulosilyticum sp. I15G10I2]|uniref:riboflavin synthase n=1 Tax=Cellulosilyticum sp. I15G10I2 TaxID=1892843 RepID=UPI00085CCDF3|nr:riboflavin synthase [Cellulosilyticum sp. I15G10I2]